MIISRKKYKSNYINLCVNLPKASYYDYLTNYSEPTTGLPLGPGPSHYDLPNVFDDTTSQEPMQAHLIEAEINNEPEKDNKTNILQIISTFAAVISLLLGPGILYKIYKMIK